MQIAIVRACVVGQLLVSSVLGIACKAQVLKHDQTVAARGAEEFLRRLVVEHDVAAAHSMLSDSDQRQFSVAKLEETVKQEHTDRYPATVRATEYEPVPGQAAISIFLVGENGAEKFYYRVPMLGTVTSGYHPGGFFRGSGPYPSSSSLRQSLTR